MTREQLLRIAPAASEHTIRRTLAYHGEDPDPAGTKPGPATRLKQDHKPLVNKLEAQFWQILKVRYPENGILVQALRFRLGNGIWYKPDFALLGPRITLYEVKGPHAFRGGFENLKVAASLYPMFDWRLVWKDGPWQEQQILP